MKTFTDKNGKRGIVGKSKVRIVDIYTEKETDIILVPIGGYKQGADGTILKFDSPPMPQVSIYNLTHCAADVIIVN